MRRPLSAGVVTACLAACGGGGTSAPIGPAATYEVAQLRLFDTIGADISGHIMLIHSEAKKIEVRLYSADGNRTAVEGGLELGFTFIPSSVAVARPIDSLLWVVTPTAAAGTFGDLTISLRSLKDDVTTPPFGPFHLLIH